MMNKNNSLLNKIKLFKGDITAMEVDAIVNAANTTLLGGGGVDGAIHRAAGTELKDYCRKIGGCPTGEARITPGFKLKAKWIIHTVGPVWNGGTNKEDILLASCYKNSLKLAADNGIKTIAFPSISTGAYRFPLEPATKIAVGEVLGFLKTTLSIQEITFVCFNDEVLRCYEKVMSKVA
jgi:O-acetyl-ADP-ribose deacetylase (regulator of RNase III)